MISVLAYIIYDMLSWSTQSKNQRNIEKKDILQRIKKALTRLTIIMFICKNKKRRLKKKTEKMRNEPTEK